MSDVSIKKREKIMMSLAGLAMVYMLITFLMPSDKKEVMPTAGPADGDLLATISQGLGDLTDKDAAWAVEVLALAAKPWQNAVFSPAEEVAAATDTDGTEAPADLAYTGYMGMGKGQLAIINGKDYQSGDRVEGYVLKEITPGAVLLEKNGAAVRVNIQAPTE